MTEMKRFLIAFKVRDYILKEMSVYSFITYTNDAKSAVERFKEYIKETNALDGFDKFEIIAITDVTEIDLEVNE